MPASDADIIAHGKRLAALEMKVERIYEHLQIAVPVLNPNELSPEVQQLTQEGRDLEAIKMHREQADVSLAEAHDAIDRHRKGG